jgi:hypothetical protein
VEHRLEINAKDSPKEWDGGESVVRTLRGTGIFQEIS